MGDNTPDFSAAKAIARQSMAYMDQYRAPPTPQNFELFYVYAAGLNKGLSMAMSDILAAKNGLSPQDADDIYREYIRRDGLGDTIGGIGQTLTNLMRELLTALKTASASADGFENSLGIARERMRNAKDPQDYETCMRSLIETSREMKKTNEALAVNFTKSLMQIDELNHCLELARTESIIDSLTGIANRGCFDRRLEEAVDCAVKDGSPLTLVMVDIDHFKPLNDKFGHQVGDAVLRCVAQTIRATIKGKDLAARYGGEEFAVILPNTALEQGITVAEQIRRSIGTKSFHRKSSGEKLGSITVSAGVAEFSCGETPDRLIDRADSSLYAAKRAGRNRVLWDPGQEGARGSAA